jgi:hypothetical protein
VEKEEEEEEEEVKEQKKCKAGWKGEKSTERSELLLMAVVVD